MHFDQATNSAFLQLSDAEVCKPGSHTISLDPWLVGGLVNLYLDEEGRIVGVEFCEARALLPPEILPPGDSAATEGDHTA